jgi:hypothetical protein
LVAAKSVEEFGEGGKIILVIISLLRFVMRRAI